MLDLAVRARLGAALVDEGRHAEAIEAFHLALEVHPQPADLHSHLGLARERLGDAEQAGEALRRALELAGDDTPAWLGDATRVP